MNNDEKFKLEVLAHLEVTRFVNKQLEANQAYLLEQNDQYRAAIRTLDLRVASSQKEVTAQQAALAIQRATIEKLEARVMRLEEKQENAIEKLEARIVRLEEKQENAIERLEARIMRLEDRFLASGHDQPGA